MAVNLDKQVLNISKAVARDSQVIWIEQDILVPDTKPDVVKVIQATGIPMISNIEVLDEKIKITGEITYYILYRSVENNETKGISMTYPFTQNINVKEAKKGMHARVEAVVRNIIYASPNERKISLKSEIIFKYILNDIKDIEIIKQIDSENNIEFKMVEELIYNVVSTKKEIIDIEEDIVIPNTEPEIKEILKVGAKIDNAEYKVSYNKILTKGDLKLQLLYTTKLGETNLYNIEFPFTGMIEFEDITDNSKFDIKYTLKNLEVVLNKESNVINISAEITADVIMYEERQISYVNDFYSTNKELKYSTEDVVVIKNKNTVEKTINTKEVLGSAELNSKIVGYNVDTSYLTTKISSSNLYINGSLKANVLIENTETNIIENKTYDILLDETISLGKDIDEKYVDIKIDVRRENIVIANGNIEANISLSVIVTIENVDKIIVVGNIEEVPQEEDFTSMYMYIVKKGDTLWDIAKRYKTSVAKITNINNIEDENKLDIGQKLLIIR